MDKKYNEELFREISGIFEELGWKPHISSQTGTVLGRSEGYDSAFGREAGCFVLVFMEEFLVTAIWPWAVDPADTQMLQRMAEFVCRMNNYMAYCDLELDFDTGQLSCKYHVYCRKALPSHQLLKEAVLYPLESLASLRDCILAVEKDPSSVKTVMASTLGIS